jgi:protein-L-isoaspartate O-methyltransferase
MSRPIFVRSFVSNTPEYHQVFAKFLAHTDQKRKAFDWIRREVEKLPARSTLIDVGAGNGELTARLMPSFERVIAIEPNPSLGAELRAVCPTAEVISTQFMDAIVPAKANFILCSHVFYYIPRVEWEVSLQRLITWLESGGVLAITIQNPQTDCMRMVRHFIGNPHDLNELCQTVGELKAGVDFDARVETVPAHIETEDLQTACEIAEFVLNVLPPIPSPPTLQELERYVEEHFRQPGGRYRYSAHQDFLRVVRRR